MFAGLRVVLTVVWGGTFSKLQSISEVPSVVDPAGDIFNRYFVDRGAPVILVGSETFKGMPGIEDIVAQGAGDMPVVARHGNYLEFNQRRGRRMALSEYVDRYIRQKGARKKKRARSLPPYAAHIRLSREQVQSLGLHPPIGFERKRLARPNLWLGPGGSLTPLHYDSNDNLLCQCAGRKRLMLYPPSQIKWLYTRGYSPAWSRVPNPLEPDLESYPRFARARHVDVTLNPGEILYLPARWAHFAYNLDASLMVNYWTEQTTLQRLLKSLELRMRRTRKRLRTSEWER